jgi:predicted nuclease of predicted toxin-antitoxin system
MLRLFFDHDFNHRILRGLTQKISDLDFVNPSQLGNITESDENHLEWALENRRVVVSHDVNTMSEAANQRLKHGEPIFGLLLVPQEMPIGEAIAELEIIISCSEENEFENLVKFLPLGL